MDRDLQFSDYAKITDTLMYLSKDITLTFVTSLSRKDKAGSNNDKVFFHTETEYKGSMYIKRQMMYFFNITDLNNFTNNMMLKPQDVALLLMILEKQVLPWYIGSKRIYSLQDHKLYINGEYKEVIYAQSEYVYLKLLPIVYTYEDGTAKEGARMYLNSEDTYADLDLDKLMGFYYILKNTDMYSAACSMVNYAKTQPYGTNIYRPQGLGAGYNPDKNDVWRDDEVHQSNAAKKRNAFLDNVKRKEEGD